MEQEPENLSHIQNHVVTQDRQLSLLVKMDEPHKVMQEVRILFLDMFKNGDLTQICRLFEDILQLFDGNLTGYKPCDTPYHNLKHTTDVFLAMARLLHGAYSGGAALKEVDAGVGLVAALLHDTGYLQKESESMGSGAVFSALHVQRSMDFTQQHLSKIGFSGAFIRRCKTMILATDLEHPFSRIIFSTDADKMVAQMIGASDLMAQTADRNYLEKLPLLFEEFQAANIHRYKTPFDFIRNALAFDDYMKYRLSDTLRGIDRFMRPHFRKRWGLDRNMYREAIDRSMTYLSAVLKTDGRNYGPYLRRVKGL